MNNLQSMKDALSSIRNGIQKQGEELNEALRCAGIRTESFDKALTMIDKQIVSVENKFTIAFVGTFKTGKSTIINSLLELKDSARLSSEYDPDTAKCIRIMDKEGHDCEAEVDFGDAYPVERLSWAGAKKYTSHVALEKEDISFREKAAKINEVRYYVDSPFLKFCNILDLPGTGTGDYYEDTIVADEKIMESDCFFWVVPTDGEPDLETLANLEKIRYKILPIINVWQYEKEGIRGDFAPEDIIQRLQDTCGAYLENADDPVIYYAKEIDMAQREGREVKPEWGREAFVEKVESILMNIQSGDRADRIRKNVENAIAECEQILRTLEDNRQIKAFRADIDEDRSEIGKLQKRLIQCDRVVRGDIRNSAKRTADDITDIIAAASDNFVESAMSGLTFGKFFQMIGRKNQEKIAEELKEDFEKKYIRLDSGWLDDCIGNYAQDTVTLLKGKYIEFADGLGDIAVEDHSGGDLIGDMTGFITNMAGQIQKECQGKAMEVIKQLVVIFILRMIPGDLLDALYTMFAGGKTVINLGNNSKLYEKMKMVKATVRVQVRQQKGTIFKELDKIGQDLAKQCREQVSDRLDERLRNNDDKKKMAAAIDGSLEAFRSGLNMDKDQLNHDLFVKEG